MKLYYYKDPEGNFGDDLNAWLWQELIPGIWDGYDDVTVSGIGTIISEDMPPARKWVVMSSGTGYTKPPANFGSPDWNIICVRGPLTAMALGIPPEKSATDGAILISLLPQYQPVEESRRSGIVFMPHHFEMQKFGRWREACERAGIEFLDPRSDSKQLLERIRHARLVLADAMHAAIVADTLRVPWIPVTVSSQTNSFKWLDWTLSLQLEYNPVRLKTSSLIEAAHSTILRLLDRGNRFSELSVDGARKYYSGLIARNEHSAAGSIKRILGKTFITLKTLSKQGWINAIYKKFDDRYLDRAARSLRNASTTQAFLSSEIVFLRRRNEMKLHLETLKALSKPVEAPSDSLSLKLR